MSNIPKLIDLISFSEKSKGISGQFPLSKCGRLLDMVPEQNQSIWVSLQFGKQGATFVVTGEVKTEIEVTCQSCLDRLSVRLECKVSLGLVHSLDAIGLLPEGFEPLLIESDDSVMDVADIIQDELILALPQYPRHEHCLLAKLERPITSNDDERENPFGVLKRLNRV